MTKTLIPTYQFRWLKRGVPAPLYGEGIFTKRRILQQRFTDTGGHNEQWIDVPEVGE